ncbi:MAG: YjbH domain-containing protein [Melioribacteraceae bacterium]
MKNSERTLIPVYKLNTLKWNLIFLIFFFFSMNILQGQSDTPLKNILIEKLEANGFENIRVKVDGERVIIGYENRVFRFDAEAIREVIGIMIPELIGKQKIILLPQNRKIPIISIGILISDCADYLGKKNSGEEFSRKLKIDFNTDPVIKELQDEELSNSSSFRFDIGFRPQLKFEFGPYEKPVISQVNIIPGVKTSWWKGMNFNYEFIIPLVNEFGNREDSIRPGLIVLNQVIRFKNDFFVSASAGYFTQNRYGLDLDVRKFISNGDISFNLNLGATSIASFSGMRRLYYYDAFKLTGSIGCEYRIERYDLTLGLTAGKFLMGDESVRFDINREFGEIEIGFFAIRSRGGISNGGINLIIPLFPSHYWKPDFVRIKTDENFSWSYLVKTDSDQLIGLRYNTGNRMGVFNKKLNPSFIRNYFQKN